MTREILVNTVWLQIESSSKIQVCTFFFFRWCYSPLGTLACWTIPLHFSPSITNSLHLLTPITLRSLSTSSFHPFLGIPLRLVPSSSWVKIFLGILSSSILCRWPSQLILCPFIHFTIFSPLLSTLLVLDSFPWQIDQSNVRDPRSSRIWQQTERTALNDLSAKLMYF